MTSHLTQSEIDALQESTLSRETPFLIRGVSQSQFSIARYYGAAKFNGATYTYVEPTDELIRDDVLKWLATQRKPKTRRKRPASS